VTGPASGTLVLNADGSFTYTPDPEFSGTDEFTYQADDGKDLSTNVATVTITIDPVNDAPTAVDDSYSMAKGGILNVSEPGVLANDFDVEGDEFALNTTPVIGPATGNSLTLNADGSFTYTPDPSFKAKDSFVYEICETLTPENCGQATVTISVGVNSAPVAVDDAYDAVQNTDLVVPAPGVLVNDTDADGDPLTAVLVTGPANGTLTLGADGLFTYTPTFNFVGVDSFTYVANDGAVDSNTATVTITVNDVVAVATATYRQRQDRWQIDGTVSNATSSVEVYLDYVDADNPGTLLGVANVDDISGDWSLNERGLGIEPPEPPTVSTVTAVSSGGGVSAPFPVTIILR
ncbi:MAG TPA: Ig-like domain-containing protein, partial [Acidimicrobiia bacterium]|nr:Ig-like domain-containing protein [Acidimicrobiia bacterium]